jgi:chitinase
VKTALTLLEDYGFDGLDIDYEFPTNDAQASGYVNLLHELRRALDEHATKKKTNYRFPLTVRTGRGYIKVKLFILIIFQIAAPCGADNYKKLHVAKMNEVLDFWNLMAYDYCKL